MPSRGSEYGLVVLQDKRASKFKTPQPIQCFFTDNSGREWQLHFGTVDSDEKNYGLFDGPRLIAHVMLTSPESEGECPTPFWIISWVGVETGYDGKAIGRNLVAAVCKSHGLPLASDVNQNAGGAKLWEGLIRDNPGRIELHDGQGESQPVGVDGDRLVPDPWKHPDKRLVRRF